MLKYNYTFLFSEPPVYIGRPFSLGLANMEHWQAIKEGQRERLGYVLPTVIWAGCFS